MFFHDVEEEPVPYNPLFTDKLPVTDEVKAICGNDTFCIVDMQVTEKRDFALQTRNENAVNTENKINIGK